MISGLCCSLYLKYSRRASQQLARRSYYRVAPDKRTNIIFGANTDVGKTIVSTGLVKSVKNRATHYIKPLQCGTSDHLFVERYTTKNDLSSARILVQLDHPMSPHTASIIEDKPCSDKEVLDKLTNTLYEISQTDGSSVTYIETAGGVLSPSTASPQNDSPRHAKTRIESGNSVNTWGWMAQGDLYQPLIGYAPVVLVGDGRLGGISCTISALESLIVRGYDVAALVLIETQNSYGNLQALKEYITTRDFRLRSGTGEELFPIPSQCMLSLPPIPTDPKIPLFDWYASEQVTETFSMLNNYLQNSWEGQCADLQGTLKVGHGKENAMWWPETFSVVGSDSVDSSSSSSSSIPIIDSAVGEKLFVLENHDNIKNDKSPNTLKHHAFIDASASGWTQALGHGESTLALSAAAAAGRYGYVAATSEGGNAIHAPALSLAQTLLQGSSWADRIFFSDNADSGIETAIRMGFQTYQKRMGLSTEEAERIDWIVSCQEDCYHGDTLGVLNVAEPYVDREHVWYEQKGFVLETPTLGYRSGKLSISFPEGMQPTDDVTREFDSIEQAYDIDARSLNKLRSLYKEWIEMQWLVHEHRSQMKIGSIILEPVLQCTGGMKFVDPLFQKAMVEVAKSRNIPVIFDETTVGLYRFGVTSCRDILRVDPDIAVYSKLLSGGLTSITATLTSEDVFNSCHTSDTIQRLQNGNSTIASPVACNTALHSLSSLKTIFRKWEEHGGSGPCLFFDEDLVKNLSNFDAVESALTLGTVLSVKLYHDDPACAVTLATDVVRSLRSRGILTNQLNDVVYIMVSPLATKENCSKISDCLFDAISKLD